MEIFKELDLQITVNICLKSTNFLDVNLNLKSETHKPYRKPNDEAMYISTQSNHPPIIIKNLPKAINSRVTKLSSNKEIFETAS